MTGFTIADALSRLAAAHADYARLIEDKNFDIGIYRPKDADPQTPHARDEIYVVAVGAGEFVSGGDIKTFAPGDVFFVRAGTAHRFQNFSDDFSAWVIFFGQRPERNNEVMHA